MGEHRKRMLTIGALALVVLTGCTNPPDPTPSSTATSTPRPTVTLKPEATPTPTASDTPDANGDETTATAFTAESSYELCVATVLDGNAAAEGGARSDYVAVPFAEAEVIERPDGYFWVWANYSNGHAPAEIRDVGAVTCLIGGTLENPHLPLYGSSMRIYRADTDPFYDFTQPAT